MFAQHLVAASAEVLAGSAAVGSLTTPAGERATLHDRPIVSSGGLRSPTGFADHLTGSATANHALTTESDHLEGTGHTFPRKSAPSGALGSFARRPMMLNGDAI